MLDEAEQHFKNSLELCEVVRQSNQDEYFSMKAGALVNLGLVYDAKNNVDISASYHLQAVDICEYVLFVTATVHCRFCVDVLRV